MASKKKSQKSTPSGTTEGTTDTQTNILLLDSSESSIAPRCVSLKLNLKGTPASSGEFSLYAYFNGILLLSGKWVDGEILLAEVLPINLNERNIQVMVANSPLILLLRSVGGKLSKDTDPLAHPDNRAGASVDLFPLLLGEQKVFVKSPLVSIITGERTNCSVAVQVVSLGTKDNNLVPLVLTMISVHCLPAAKENTFYISAIGLDEIHEPVVINFNLALSTPIAEKIVFAAVNVAGYAANTAMNVHTDDKFVPNDLRPKDKPNCRSFYWNAMRRVLVEPELLFKRLSLPFMIEIAGVPRSGKTDVRGRYTGFVDAGVLLEPGQMGVTVCSKLLLYNEANIPENMSPLLDLPPMSAKASVRDVDPNVTDEFGHSVYAVIRFDLAEPLVPKTRLENLYDIIGFPVIANSHLTPNNLGSESVQLDVTVDANMIRKEGGALAVHKELSGLACKGTIPMNQGIKRTAANHLLMRVRAMLKSFPPGDCSYLVYEDTVTAHHAASRRAVTASFAPQPPPPRLPEKVAAARCRIVGDTRIANKHLEVRLNAEKSRPSALISKTIRCLEDRNNVAAKQYLLEALSSLTTNRYLLWIYGGLEFDEENDGNVEIAGAALRLAAKGDYSDGTANAIGWAALHTLHHSNDNIYAAFVAAKKMRKAFSLPIEWDKVLDRWTENSGEEEVYWTPEVISKDNPFLIAAAFFLCLRCYKFSEKLLQCVEQGCATRGSIMKCKISPDVYYLRAASHILRYELRAANAKIQQAIKKFGPTPKMSQMRAICLARGRPWDKECEKALQEAEQAGSQLCSSLLYSAALSGFKSDPETALQRAARAHKNNPSGHTALLIGRIYVALDKQWFAERWLAAAVNTEPLLADGWAMLALLAMYDRNFNKAKIMYRTAKQAGPISEDIDEEVRKVRKIVKLDELPDILVKIFGVETLPMYQ